LRAMTARPVIPITIFFIFIISHLLGGTTRRTPSEG